MKIQALIAEIRAAGYKVRVRHYRLARIRGGSLTNEFSCQALKTEVGGEFVIMPNGGRVEAEIKDASGNSFQGEARCSVRDGFCRRVGTAIALGRAWKNANTIKAVP